MRTSAAAQHRHDPPNLSNRSGSHLNSETVGTYPTQPSQSAGLQSCQTAILPALAPFAPFADRFRDGSVRLRSCGQTRHPILKSRSLSLKCQPKSRKFFIHLWPRPCNALDLLVNSRLSNGCWQRQRAGSIMRLLGANLTECHRNWPVHHFPGHVAAHQFKNKPTTGRCRTTRRLFIPEKAHG